MKLKFYTHFSTPPLLLKPLYNYESAWLAVIRLDAIRTKLDKYTTEHRNQHLIRPTTRKSQVLALYQQHFVTGERTPRLFLYSFLLHSVFTHTPTHNPPVCLFCCIVLCYNIRILMPAKHFNIISTQYFYFVTFCKCCLHLSIREKQTLVCFYKFIWNSKRTVLFKIEIIVHYIHYSPFYGLNNMTDWTL